MLLRSVVFLIAFSSALSTATAKLDCAERLSRCEGRKRNKVCGSNGKTYDSKCDLIKEKCSTSPNLRVSYKGSCSDKPPCWKEVAQTGSSPAPGIKFIPECTADGWYAPIQCHEYTGWCWCVTPVGTPISNTSTRLGRPVCKSREKKRRGSAFNGRRKRKDCGRIERAAFVNNLVRIFKTEYNRSEESRLNSSSVAEIEARGVEWKFHSLDADKNGVISKIEFRDTRKLVKKLVKPKKCARSFARFCDPDKDGSITKIEWLACLEKQPVRKKKGGKKKTKVPGRGMGVFQENVPYLNGPLSQGEQTENTEQKEEVEANNCLTDRKSVLEEQKSENTQIYVPECTLDGRYKKIQCYTSTGYCWCVHEDTGKPIPGTSVKDSNPKCDAVQPPVRPMKGCPEERRRQYLKNLMTRIEFMKPSFEEAMSNRSDPSIILSTPQSGNEQLATLFFRFADKNRNKVLEKKGEWKVIRQMAKAQPQQWSRCGLQLPKYCDVNNDAKISITEWYKCLSFEAPTTGTSPTSSPISRRRGSNPLDIYLKSE